MKADYLIIIVLLFLGIPLNAQEVIALPYEKAKDVSWEGASKDYHSDIWDTQVVTNVSIPSMEVFLPENPNGTAVIVAPGGGLYALSIWSEGNGVAEWLNKKGITAFVLKYRLVPTGADGVADISRDSQQDPDHFMEKVGKVLPYSVQDGLQAVTYVREHAEKWNIDPTKIGFMGFSAGGAVALGVAYSYTPVSRPDFLVPVYPWTTAQPVSEVPEDAPPLLVICATDDPLDLAAGSIALYSSWQQAGKPVGLHMFAKGGHGFGMKKQGLPSDNWIARFHEWAVAQNLVPPTEYEKQ